MSRNWGALKGAVFGYGNNSYQQYKADKARLAELERELGQLRDAQLAHKLDFDPQPHSFIEV